MLYMYAAVYSLFARSAICGRVSNPGATSISGLEFILLKGLLKQTLNTFFRYGNRPYICVFTCVFLHLSIMSFPKFVTMTKNTPLFSNFAPLNDVCAYTAWSWKNNPNWPVSHSARHQRPARERHKIHIASQENVDNQAPRNTNFTH